MVFFFHFLLFLYPLLSFAWRRDYPTVSTEVLAFVILALLISVLLVIVLQKLRDAIANGVSLLLISLCFLVQFNLLLTGLLVCIVAFALLALLAKRSFHQYGLIVLCALILGAYLDSRGPEPSGNSGETRVTGGSDLPPVIHVILDSAIGTGGLPDHTASGLMEAEITHLFNEFGFQSFPRAYSHYSQTGDSMLSAFNYQAEGVSRFGLDRKDSGQHILPASAYLDAMKSLGYRFNIYQTAHLDYCESQAGSVNRCWNYEQPNVLSIQSASSTRQRLTMLLAVIVNQSELLTGLLNSRGLLLNLGIAVHDPKVFEELEEDIVGDPEGTYFLAHVLLPHGPFAYLNDCSVNYDSPIWARYANMKNEPRLADWAYEVRNVRYFEQMDCAMNELRQLFTSLKANGIFDRSVIVIHGDHGSMISRFQPDVANMEQLTSADFRAGFSVMFAVKPPFASFQEEQQVVSLPILMKGVSDLAASASLGQASGSRFADFLPESSQQEGEFVYLFGEYPLRRVEVELFGGVE